MMRSAYQLQDYQGYIESSLICLQIRKTKGNVDTYLSRLNKIKYQKFKSVCFINNKIDISASPVNCSMYFILVDPARGTCLSWWPLRSSVCMPFVNCVLLSLPTALRISLFFFSMFLLSMNSWQCVNKVLVSLIGSIACSCQFSDRLPHGPGSRLQWYVLQLFCSRSVLKWPFFLILLNSPELLSQSRYSDYEMYPN